MQQITATYIYYIYTYISTYEVINIFHVMILNRQVAAVSSYAVNLCIIIYLEHINNANELTITVFIQLVNILAHFMQVKQICIKIWHLALGT